MPHTPDPRRAHDVSWDLFHSGRMLAPTPEELDAHLANVPDADWFEDVFLPHLRSVIQEEIAKANAAT